MSRSNRHLTQFAVEKIDQFLVSPCTFQSETKGNTSVELVVENIDGDKHEVLHVTLFGEEIFSAVLSRASGVQVVGIILRGGNFYDGQGRPTRTTRERLNGLLDYMSSIRVLPEGVRVFIEKDAEECYVGRGANRIRLDKDHPLIRLAINSSALILS